MKYFSFLALIFLLLPGETKPQTNLYLPVNFIRAYEKGTRSFDGKPGANYFQNKSDYKIFAEVDPVSRTVKGKETILYKNNSQDTLSRIYLRMYQDLYKPETSRDRGITAKEFTQGIIFDEITINNKKISERGIYRYETMVIAGPDEKVLPGAETEIKIEWSFTIPNGTSIRMGTKDSATFVVGYWYPQIAVYDDLNGWDDLVYNGNTEFYNDFNNYDVEVKVPYNFNVWATGELQNPEEVLSMAVLKKYNFAKTSDEIISLIDSVNIREKNYYNKTSGFNTWKFRASNVTDFVFGISSHHLWDASSAEVEPGRRVMISSSYNKSAKDFYSVCKVSRDAVLYFSNDLPGVPFPYPSLTVFNGQFRGGMEFPMFVNDRSAKTYNEMVDVTAHEIAHQYFPFFMGINEKRYTWMEEGMAQMLPEDLQDNLSSNTRKRKANTKRYENFAGDELEASMMTTGYLLKGDAFSSNAYFKSAVVYNLLRDYFGKEKYKEILKEYIRRWNGKHPSPYDYFFTVNEASGENLEWFWQPWFFEKGFPNLAVKEIRKTSDKNIIVVENKGTLPLPVELTIKYTDGTSGVISKRMDVWKNSGKEIEISDESGKEIKNVILGNEMIPDINDADNYYKN
ncbi:MAG: M1 family metallopeptidase [Ignavibacteria bacterium]|nr:M1 family metallopeptidase [Ignavibacteria bacterium]